jgi:hypothetical protein
MAVESSVVFYNHFAHLHEINTTPRLIVSYKDINFLGMLRYPNSIDLYDIIKDRNNKKECTLLVFIYHLKIFILNDETDELEGTKPSKVAESQSKKSITYEFNVYNKNNPLNRKANIKVEYNENSDTFTIICTSENGNIKYVENLRNKLKKQLLEFPAKHFALKAARGGRHKRSHKPCTHRKRSHRKTKSRRSRK